MRCFLDAPMRTAGMQQENHNGEYRINYSSRTHNDAEKIFCVGECAI